jgi:two-component system, NarL family, response regulator LiaR
MNTPRCTRAPLERLTQREAEIVELLALGLSNRAIADQLGIAIGTVRAHCVNAFEKLGVANRTQAALAHVQRDGP